MIVTERFRQRLADLGISQAELGRRLKVSQSSINRMVNGEITGTKHLHHIARELATSAEYLTGETDDPSPGPRPPPALDWHQRELLAIFDALPGEEQALLVAIARRFARAAEPESPPAIATVHASTTAWRGEDQ